MDVKKKDFFVNHFLRGIAIIAVVILHVLSVPHGIYNAPATQWWAVGLDQALRFCVPLFVAISGYGFWLKYQERHLHKRQFLLAQIEKLLPPYILASAA